MRGLPSIIACTVLVAGCGGGGGARISAVPNPGFHPSSIRLYEDAMAAPACARRTPEPRFYPGTAELLPGEQLAIQQLGACMQAPQFASLRLVVVGGSDQPTPDAAGRALAFERAARVEEVLVDAGVPPQRIATLATDVGGPVGRARVTPFRGEAATP